MEVRMYQAPLVRMLPSKEATLDKQAVLDVIATVNWISEMPHGYLPCFSETNTLEKQEREDPTYMLFCLEQYSSESLTQGLWAKTDA
eukprot:4446271-Amphidinium_carterae.1